MDIRKNDTVKVISGGAKGKTGKVLEVFQDTNRVRIEKVNTVKRHIRKGRSQSQPEGGIVEKYGTVDASNVMVVCPKCSKPTRVARALRDDGRRVRACKQCNEKWE
jgi:large subunit ribosomal protein L24